MTCLEFVHIPKTGGTSIESAACSSNVSWGSCHFYAFKHCDGCFPDEINCHQKGDVGMIWHTPPSRHNSNCGIKNYKRCETFAVVRDPVARAKSFFGCQWWGPKQKRNINSWVRKHYRNWIPQYKYLPVTHVLHYESLSSDFSNLMKMKGLSIKLRKTHANPSLASTTEKLSQKLICDIAQHFLKDYETFHYPLPAGCPKNGQEIYSA